ncbi:polysaccharide deacetylase family protein [Bacillus sp. 03113]|uniref:polysaccharide deacetylase family protein n=1 Tax=Bacillus sp. 03113 TaxID=2578211 RepID=UPI001142188F|nr:polysaccharide deacetylase family protein [Bacillus sp. 03113]
MQTRNKHRNTFLPSNGLESPFIFEKQTNKPWIFFICLSSLSFLFILILIFFLVMSLIFDPILPILKTKEANEFSTIQPSSIKNSSNPSIKNEQNDQFLNQKLKRNNEFYAFYVNWDVNSEHSLKQNIDNIDVLIPQWFQLAPNLELKSSIQEHIGLFAKKNNVKIMPLINNEIDGVWNEKVIHDLLQSPEAQSTLINNLLDQIKKFNYDGINIDFENISSSDRDLYTAFMKELYLKFHQENLFVTIDVPPANPAYNYEELEKHSDRMILMMYDENFNNPGSISSSAWFKENLSLISNEKLVVSLGNYGYDWDWGSSQAGEVISFENIMRLADKAKLKIQWDDGSKNPYIRYNEGNKPHEIWFLDSITFYNQLKEATQNGAKGIALWRLGTEDPSVWSILSGQKTENIQTISSGDRIISTGQGNIFRSKQEKKDGKRSIVFDHSGFISSETYDEIPKMYELNRLNKSPNKEIALTFDDGPDPKYTRKILEILNQHHIKATFFIIGKNALKHQDIIKQMVQDGHEIGNHTYSHPNTDKMSYEKVKFELNVNERIIQGLTGRSTLLYRSPYGDANVQYYPSNFERMKDLTRLGYITVNYDVDSKDWTEHESKPIVDRVINQTEDGNIILLHDGGGDRSATVQALPQIIENLQSKGYRFVPISELMGKNKNDVMPSVTETEKTILQSVEIALFQLSSFEKIISILLLSFISFFLLRFMILVFLAIKHKIQSRLDHQENTFNPFVSVIIPAYNEEKVILNTIKSVLKSNYSNFEIIIVDDGSTDLTSKVVSESFPEDEQILLLKKRNEGKAKAINFGIQHAKGNILIAIDADTIVSSKAISLLVHHFTDQKVAAVSGNIKVGNLCNLLTYWQHIEYVTGFNLEKRAFASLNCVTVVPGAIGAWRKKIVQDLGYFTADTLAEDTDMTLRILRQGYKVKIEERANAFTEAPESTKNLLKQRFRWTFGTLQCVWKHKKAFFEGKNKSLGFIAIPNMFLFQFVFPLFAPFLDILFLLGLVSGHIHQSFLYYIAYFMTDFLICLIAFRVEKLSLKPIILIFLQRIVYRYLLLFVVWTSIIAAIRGNRVGWSKLKRSGKMDIPKAFERIG